MILNLRVSARSHMEQHTLTTAGTSKPMSEWGTIPRFAGNESVTNDSDDLELSTVGRSSYGTRTCAEA